MKILGLVRRRISSGSRGPNGWSLKTNFQDTQNILRVSELSESGIRTQCPAYPRHCIWVQRRTNALMERIGTPRIAGANLAGAGNDALTDQARVGQKPSRSLVDLSEITRSKAAPCPQHTETLNLSLTSSSS